MTIEQARQIALSLPRATEQPHFDKASFRVDGRIFATAPPGGLYLHVFLDEPDSRALAETHAGVMEELWWGKRLVGGRIHLPSAAPETVQELLTDSWRARAHSH